MTDLVLSQGVRVINGVEMMGSRKLMSICGVGEHKHFVEAVKKLFKVEKLDFSDIKGVFVELHDEPNLVHDFEEEKDIREMLKFVNKDVEGKNPFPSNKDYGPEGKAMNQVILSQGVRIINGQPMMSTKGIVDVCEKIGEPKRHADIIRDVRNMLKSLDAVLRLNITDSYEEEKQTLLSGEKETVQFWLNKKLCDTLISGYSIPIRYAIIEEFDKLSNQKKTPMEIFETMNEEQMELSLSIKKEASAKIKALTGEIEKQNEMIELKSKSLLTSQHNNSSLTRKNRELLKVTENMTLSFDQARILESLLAKVFSLQLRITGDKEEAGKRKGRTQRALKETFGLNYGKHTWKDIRACDFEKAQEIVLRGIEKLEQEFRIKEDPSIIF